MLFHIRGGGGELLEVDGLGHGAALEFLGGEHRQRGKLHRRRGTVDRRGVGVMGDGPRALDHRGGGGVAETHAHLADLAASVGDGLHLIDRHSGLFGGEFGGIHRVVAEVFGFQAILLEADQLVTGHPLRIEAHLHLHVLRRRAEGPGESSGESRIIAALADDVVAAVAVAGEFA